MSSIRMYFIVVVAFLERFAFSSLRSVLLIYMNDVLLYDEKISADIYHMFIMLCYTAAIVGGIMGNAFGKYETVLTYSIVYWIGTLMLLKTNVMKMSELMNFLALYSIVFISIGVGSIKSCLGTFGMDQLESDKNVSTNHVREFFSTFHFSVNLGLFFGMLTPSLIVIIKSYLGYDDMDTYEIRFVLSAITMAIAIIVFVCGYGQYFLRKPEGNILPKMIKCILIALWRKSTSCRQKLKKNHWLDYARDSFSNRMTINDTKKTLHILSLYIPLSIFWSLFHQQNTTWIFQAARTRDSLFGIKFPAYMLQLVNPLLVLVCIPLMERIVHPFLRKRKLFKHPLKRMLLGGAIAGMAFFIAGCIEMYLENHVHHNIAVTKVRGCIVDKRSCPRKIPSHTPSQSHVLSKEWLLPQFIFMAFGETLFTTTGLAFAFSEAPKSMKAVSISMWFFSVALGNLIVIFINKTIEFQIQSHMFFMFTFSSLVAIFVTYKLSNAYEKTYGDYVESSVVENNLNAKNDNKVMVLQKESYPLLI